jgi:hypothetical protein
VPRGCGRNGAPLQALANGVGYQRGRITARNGSIELLAEFIIKSDRNTDGHVKDATNDTAGDTITHPIGVSPGHVAQ